MKGSGTTLLSTQQVRLLTCLKPDASELKLSKSALRTRAHEPPGPWQCGNRARKKPPVLMHGRLSCRSGLFKGVKFKEIHIITLYKRPAVLWSSLPADDPGSLDSVGSGRYSVKISHTHNRAQTLEGPDSRGMFSLAMMNPPPMMTARKTKLPSVLVTTLVRPTAATRRRMAMRQEWKRKVTSTKVKNLQRRGRRILPGSLSGDRRLKSCRRTHHDKSSEAVGRELPRWWMSIHV